VLALSTCCAPAAMALDRALAAFRPFRVDAAVLHRAPEPQESAALATLARQIRVVALFAQDAAATAGARLLVVEGGPAAPDRERSLEDLCRRIHALRGCRVALRTPATPEDHPSAAEIAPICEAVAHAGYWHDLSRGGAGYLDAAEGRLLGASFDPGRDEGIPLLRDALPSSAPATICLPAGTPRVAVAQAVERARGVFRT